MLERGRIPNFIPKELKTEQPTQYQKKGNKIRVRLTQGIENNRVI